MSHHYQDLIQLFDKTFSETYNTRLIKGGDEPIYLPKSNECTYHQVIFARGFYASAFHEISHWCHAGTKRRLVEDYGYWYVPDGRDELQQAKFEQVEVIPQAIEWAFNVAVGKKFHVSADNLNGFQADSECFRLKVYAQVLTFIEYGFPERAQRFIEVLAHFYQTSLPLTREHFQSDTLNASLKKYELEKNSLEINYAVI
jgi:elongation factor P hydroxylase